jgi:hypothetical protein
VRRKIDRALLARRLLISPRRVCCFFSGFTLVFFYWVENFHSLFFDTDSSELLPVLRVLFWIANVLLYGFQITVVGIYLYRHVALRLEPLAEDNLYIASIMIVGASDLLVSVGFLFYGLRMFFVNKQLTDDLSPANRRQRLVTLVSVSSERRRRDDFASCVARNVGVLRLFHIAIHYVHLDTVRSGHRVRVE